MLELPTDPPLHLWSIPKPSNPHTLSVPEYTPGLIIIIGRVRINYQTNPSYQHYLWWQEALWGILGDALRLHYFRRCFDLQGRHSRTLGERIDRFALRAIDKLRLLAYLRWRGKKGIFLLAQVLQNIPQQVILIETDLWLVVMLLESICVKLLMLKKDIYESFYGTPSEPHFPSFVYSPPYLALYLWSMIMNTELRQTRK